MENIKKPAAPENRGRPKLGNPKVEVRLYIRESVLASVGGKDPLKKMLYEHTQELYKLFKTS